MSRTPGQLRRDALSILQAALQASNAAEAVRRHLTRSDQRCFRAGTTHFEIPPAGRVFLLAAGKAAAPMSVAIGSTLGDLLGAGLVITKYGHVGATQLPKHIAVRESSHPVPDEAGWQAARAVHEFCRRLAPDDFLIVAISGGASALLPSPPPSISLEDKRVTTSLLLHAGADITELNTVRKHLSTLKGGGLAKLVYPATVITLLLSDVIGDDLGVIGSGITAPDETTFADALEVLVRFDLLERVPAAVREHLQRGAAGLVEETPKRGDPVFARVHHILLGSNLLALEAAAQQAITLGYRTLILSSCFDGETRLLARMHAQILREIASSGHPVPLPACILSGGETTVTVRGKGKGGRNQEFALAAAIEIAGLPDVAVLSAGTDGTDGPTDAAGAYVDGTSFERAQLLGLHAADFLARNDSYPFFDALGDLIRTGPTGTNVMDVRILLAGLHSASPPSGT